MTLWLLVVSALLVSISAITTASKKIGITSSTGGSAVGLDRIMTKKYDWELDEAATIRRNAFKIPPAKLIARAKECINSDLLDEDDFAEDFVFQFPVVGPLSKAEYLKAVGGFQIKTMFPDMNLGIHNFHVDPLSPNRVWYTVRFSATNSEDGPFGKASNIQVDCPPQTNSLTFNEQGLITKYTGGYVVDKDVGNSGGMGGLFGPLYAIGKAFPFPEAQPYKKTWQFKAFNFVSSIAQKVAAAKK